MLARASWLSRRFDLHLLLVWLFSLPALSPLWQPTLTHSADGLLHFYRLAALQNALSQGVFFPRWLPDLAYGYGFPLFVFYAPLSYYLTLLLTLPGLSLAAAFNCSLLLALLAGGTGVYLWVKTLFGPQAGLLAGVAYVYAPFPLLNAFFRGSLPAAWALAAFPFCFWLLGRLVWQRGPFLTPLLPVSALALGAALLMHNTLSLLFLPLLAFYLLLQLSARLLADRAAGSDWAGFDLIRPALRLGLAGLLGGGLAAFFLLPALAEQSFAQVERVIISPDFDFRFHFVSLSELLRWPPAANTGLLNPPTPPLLGPVQVGLAGLGLLAGLYRLWRGGTGREMIAPPRSPPQRGRVGVRAAEPPPPQREAGRREKKSDRAARLAAGLFASIALVVVTGMMLPVSRPVWEAIPLLPFVQFPHRFLGPAALCLALLAGLGGAWFPRRGSAWLVGLGLTLLFIGGASLLYPRYRPAADLDSSLAGLLAYEQRSQTIGTTSFGEYLPIWVEQTPTGSPLEPFYAAGAPVERLLPETLPPGGRIEAAEYGFNRAELRIDSPAPFQAVFQTFYFPGWAAQVDDRPAPVTPATERGLVSVPIPAGSHRLTLTFRETPLRRLANGASWLAGIVTGLTLVAAAWRRRSPAGDRPEPAGAGLTARQMAALALLAGLLLGGKLAYLDRFDNPLKRTFEGRWTAAGSAPVDFGGQVRLLGYDLPRRRVEAGEALAVTAYWQARQPLPLDYSALAHLVDEAGHLYGGQDNLHPGQLPASGWPTWGFVRDPHQVPVPAGTPPGDYFLTLGLYDPATWARLPVAEPAAGWPDVAAIPVQVEKPAAPPPLAALGIVWPVEAEFGPVRLLGATPERETIRPNDFLRVALFWEAQAAPEQAYQVGLRLLAENGAVVQQQTGPPSFGRYPTPRWAAGERVRDNHAFWIPPDFPPGRYQLQTRLVDEAGQPVGTWVALGWLGAR